VTMSTTPPATMSAPMTTPEVAVLAAERPAERSPRPVLSQASEALQWPSLLL